MVQKYYYCKFNDDYIYNNNIFVNLMTIIFEFDILVPERIELS